MTKQINAVKMPDDYIEWVEPFSDGSEPVFCRMRVADVIAVQKRRPEYKDGTDQEALDDFMAVHWARRANGTTEPV